MASEPLLNQQQTEIQAPIITEKNENKNIQEVEYDYKSDSDNDTTDMNEADRINTIRISSQISENSSDGHDEEEKKYCQNQERKSNTRCICGDELKQNKVQNCYVNSSSVSCSNCHIKLYRDEIVWNCPKNRNHETHKNGYYLCSKCAKSSFVINEDDMIYKRIRGIGHIKSYLEHFLPPNLSLSNTFSCWTTIISIILNVYFIIYNFIVLVTEWDNVSVHYSTTDLRIGNYIVVFVEFSGLSLLFIAIIISLIFNYKCITIDCIKECGSWSAFQLFYNFSPNSLINYYSICFSHHKSRLNQTRTDKFKKFVKLQHELTKEMTKDNDNDMQNAMMETLQKLEKVMNDYKTSDNELDLTKKISPDNTILSRAAQIVFVIITIILLSIGMISLLLKLAQFSYVNDTEITNWSYTQYFTFFAFCNQLWNICNIESIKIDTIYRFIFMQQNGKFTRYISNRISMLDAVIKESLCNYKQFGIRGYLLALSMNSTFLHKLIVKDEFDNMSLSQLIEYKSIITENKIINADFINKIDDNYDHCEKAIDQLMLLQKDDISTVVWKQLNDDLKKYKIQSDENKIKSHYKSGIDSMRETINLISNTLKMKSYQQPLHPYLVSESSILRYHQKTACTKFDVFYLNKKEKYNVYSMDADCEFDRQIEIKTNYMTNLSKLFEIVERIIMYIYPSIFILTWFTAWTMSILVVVYQWNDNKIYYEFNGNQCTLSYAVQFMISGSISLVFLLVFVYMYLTNVQNKIIKFLVSMLIAMPFVWEWGIGLLVIVCTGFLDISFQTDYYFGFAVSTALIVIYPFTIIPLIFAGYPMIFLLFAFIICSMFRFSMLFYIPLTIYYEMNSILDGLLTTQINGFVKFVLIFACILGTVYLISSILYYYFTKKYSKLQCESKIITCNKLYCIVLVLMHLSQIIYLILYYSLDNFDVDETWDAWTMFILFTFNWIYIAIKGKRNADYLKYIYYFDWVYCWIEIIIKIILCIMCSIISCKCKEYDIEFAAFYMMTFQQNVRYDISII